MKQDKKLGILKVKGRLDNGAYICQVDLSKLHFDTYQRLAITSHVTKIEAGWDDKAANLLKANVRRGTIFCYNGRQTSAAALKHGLTVLEAIVFEGMTFEEEARYFFIENDVPRKMSGWTKFYAGMNGGNDAFRMMVDVIHSNNLTLPSDPGIHKFANADITSARAVQEAFSEGGIPLLNRVCKVLDKAWREPCGRSCNVYTDAKRLDMLRGLIHFLRDQDFSSLPDRTLLTVLKAHPPAAIRALANHMPSKGRIDCAQIVGALVEIFGTKPPQMRRAA